MKNSHEVWVLIPARNEEKNIKNTVREVKKYTNNIIVVDSCSRDNTFKNAVIAGSKVIRNDVVGKGRATRNGISWLMKNQKLKRNDFVITMDADGQHDPRYIPKIVRYLNHDADMVVGKRNLKNYPIYKRIGNYVMNIITSLLSGQVIRDSECGFRGFKYGTLVSIFNYLEAKKYEIEMETSIAVGLKKGKIRFIEMEVPVYRRGTGVLDGIMNIYKGIRLWCRIKIQGK